MIKSGKCCLAVDSSSRMILAGGVNGLLHVWDVKAQKLRKTYKHASTTSTVTSCQYNQDDTLIAASHESGEIIFYNATSTVATGPVHANNKSAIRCLRFSYFKFNLLATVSDDGITHLWDATTRSHQHTFKTAHNAPATCLAFSPFNQMLMLSVGLDKKIICYDVLSRKNIRSMSVDIPLTSIDIYPDGTTVAVGTTRGQIVFYDLRKGSTPLMNADAHTTSVHCLSFQKKVVSKLKSNQETKLKPKHVNLNDSIEDSSTEKLRDMTNLNESSHQKSSLNKSDQGTENIFSPFREHDSVQALKTPDRLDISKMMMDRGDRDSLQMMEQNRFSDINNAIFSPIVSEANNINQSSTSHSFTPSDAKVASLNLDNPEQVDLLRLSLNASFIKDISASSQMQMQLNNLSSHAVQKILNSPIQRPTNLTASATTQPSSGQKPTSSVSHELHNCSLDSSSPHAVRDESADSNSTKLNDSSSSVTNDKLKVHFSDNTTNYHVNDTSENETGGISQTYLQGGSFPIEFIRSVIRDEMEEYFEQIRDGIVKLQAEMIKKFYQQQIEMQKLLQTYSINPDLITEINKLKEENEKLKRNFALSQLNK